MAATSLQAKIRKLNMLLSFCAFKSYWLWFPDSAFTHWNRKCNRIKINAYSSWYSACANWRHYYFQLIIQSDNGLLTNIKYTLSSIWKLVLAQENNASNINVTDIIELQQNPQKSDNQIIKLVNASNLLRFVVFFIFSVDPTHLMPPLVFKCYQTKKAIIRSYSSYNLKMTFISWLVCITVDARRVNAVTVSFYLISARCHSLGCNTPSTRIKYLRIDYIARRLWNEWLNRRASEQASKRERERELNERSHKNVLSFSHSSNNVAIF